MKPKACLGRVRGLGIPTSNPTRVDKITKNPHIYIYIHTPLIPTLTLTFSILLSESATPHPYTHSHSLMPHQSTLTLTLSVCCQTHLQALPPPCISTSRSRLAPLLWLYHRNLGSLFSPFFLLFVTFFFFFDNFGLITWFPTCIFVNCDCPINRLSF